ncbi:MAG: hypothetical protein IIY81_01825, partial [Lachnospiraceae bacterium]|nr:hypothetical protein [Lachnospiraceae bacterium]
MSKNKSNPKNELIAVSVPIVEEKEASAKKSKTKKVHHPLQDFMWKGIMCFLVIVASVLCALIFLRISDVMKAVHA